jgi:hypothetical protein
MAIPVDSENAMAIPVDSENAMAIPVDTKSAMVIPVVTKNAMVIPFRKEVEVETGSSEENLLLIQKIKRNIKVNPTHHQA